jgi:predicted transcriptional regulator
MEMLATMSIVLTGGESCMSAKKTMTLNLTDQEMEVLDELAQKKDISKTGIIRQALRLYQLIDTRLSEGARLYFENGEKNEKSELMLL